MYQTDGSFDIITNLLRDAEDYVVARDRSLYVPYFAAAEAYIVKSRIIMGGTLGLLAILGEEPPRVDQEPIEIYSENLSRDMKEILALLANIRKVPEVHPNTLLLTISNRGLEQSIQLNGRIIVNGHLLEQRKEVSIARIIDTQTAQCLFTKSPAIFFGSKAQVIRILRGLCDPDKVKMWPSLLDAIFKLVNRDPFVDKRDHRGRRGGDKHHDRPGDPHLLPISKWAPLAVIIGHPARSLYLGSESGESRRLQLIGRASDAASISEAVAREFGRRARAVPFNVHLPDDPRLRKWTIYLGGNVAQPITGGGAAGNEPIADIFSSAEYDVIPFIERGGNRIGSVFAAARFALIDEWLLAQIASTNEQLSMRDRRQKLIAHARALILAARKMLEAGEYGRVFPETYAGTFISEAIGRKLRLAKSGRPEYISPRSEAEMKEALAEIQKI